MQQLATIFITLSVRRSSHLQNIQQVLLWYIWKVNLVGRINYGLQLGNLICDALEWCFSIRHAVQDATKGPHISFGAYL